MATTPDRHPDAHPGIPGFLHQLGEVGQHGLGPLAGIVGALLLTQERDHVAEFAECLVHAGPDHAGRAGELIGWRVRAVFQRSARRSVTRCSWLPTRRRRWEWSNPAEGEDFPQHPF